MISLNRMLFGFMPGKGTLEALFIVSRMQEEYQKKGKKLYMCFSNMKNAFHRILQMVMEWTMKKKGLVKK